MAGKLPVRPGDTAGKLPVRPGDTAGKLPVRPGGMAEKACGAGGGGAETAGATEGLVDRPPDGPVSPTTPFTLSTKLVLSNGLTMCPSARTS